MEAGEYGLTRETWVFPRRLEGVAVAWLMWVSWYVFGGAGFFRAFHEFAFSNCRARAVSVESVKGLRQPANPPTENSRPPISNSCTV